MEVYLPKASLEGNTKNGYNIDTRADTEYGGSTSNTGGGRTQCHLTAILRVPTDYRFPICSPELLVYQGFLTFLNVT